MKGLTILVLDDKARLREEIAEYLEKRSHTILKAAVPSEAFNLLDEHEIDIAIVDIRLPEMNGLEVLQQIKKTYPRMEVLMISGHGDMQSVIEAMRQGAFDYFQKPFKLSEVHQAIQRTQRFIELSRELEYARNSVSTLSEKLYTNIGTPMLGSSNAILRIGELMQRVAEADTTNVLITGESGTGKELVAHGIHLLSKRSNRLFHSVNCSAITDSLFESEFFGHRKGSFTGALEDRAGWFEAASGGTLFLDEIGDMPLSQQAKLLRTLEDRTIRKVGGVQNVEVDVRVIAASNHNLEKMVNEKTFRGDLFHRLSTFTIHIPPLRERLEDLYILVDHFLHLFAKRMSKPIYNISKEVLDILGRYAFPGNIRELRNLIERAVILSDGRTLEIEHFPGFEPVLNFHTPVTDPKRFNLEAMEKATIENALKESGFNKSKAANMLGITWQTLDRKIKKHQIDSAEKPEA